MPKLLSKEKIESRLAKLEGWKYEDGFLVKELTFDSFLDGISFVNKLARLAEEFEHHPDIYIRYNKVKLLLQTHSEGGVTLWDFQLATAIEKMLIESSKSKKKKE